jgi:DNA-binding response OmpR family regulator
MIKRILLAEDEKPMAKALKYKLDKGGYQTTAVNNGKKAIESLAKEKYDLLILDLVMPEVDGFMVLKELNRTHNPIPVIVASNLGQEKDVQEARKLGAKDYLIKSDTQLSEIVAKVKKYL